MCRRWTGSGGSMTLGLEGPPEITTGQDLIKTYQSSEWGERCFCGTCGTNLFTNAPTYGYYGVSAGVLGCLKKDEEANDNAQTKQQLEQLELDEELFVDKKPSFYNFCRKSSSINRSRIFGSNFC